jgi:WNT inhibitory factor 1
MEIYAIMDGHVLPYILDPNFEKYLPIIPSEVGDLHDFQQGKIFENDN